MQINKFQKYYQINKIKGFLLNVNGTKEINPIYLQQIIFAFRP